MFEVLYRSKVVREDIPSLNRGMKKRVKTAIANRLTKAPQDYGKPLRGELKFSWSLRVGDYRVVYRLEQKRVKIIQIAHRKDAYEAGILEARRRGWF